MTDNKRAELKNRLLLALEDHKGLISSACAQCHISRETYYNWCKNDPEFKEKASEILDRVGDFVESSLMNLISKGDTPAIIFYCKTKLKNRGFVERIEQTGKDGSPIQVDSSVAGEAIEERIRKMMEKSSK